MKYTIHTAGGPVHVERQPQASRAELEFKGRHFRVENRGPEWYIYTAATTSPVRLHTFKCWGTRMAAEAKAARWIAEHVGYQPGAGKAALKARMAGKPHTRKDTR